MSPENLRERIIEDNHSSSSYGLNTQNSNEGKGKVFSIRNKNKTKASKKDRTISRLGNDEISSSSSSEDEGLMGSVPESYFKSNLDINQHQHEIYVVDETGQFGGRQPHKDDYDPYELDSTESHIKYHERALFQSEWQKDELSSSV